MTTVTMNKAPTPSEQAVEKAEKTVQVVDARGRKLTLKKPGVLAQYRLIDILEESAKNNVYVSMVLPLIFVTEIDGERCLPPYSRIALDAFIQQLGEEGVNAVMTAVQEHFGAAGADADKEAIKK